MVLSPKQRKFPQEGRSSPSQEASKPPPAIATVTVRSHPVAANRPLKEGPRTFQSAIRFLQDEWKGHECLKSQWMREREVLLESVVGLERDLARSQSLVGMLENRIAMLEHAIRMERLGQPSASLVFWTPPHAQLLQQLGLTDAATAAATASVVSPNETPRFASLVSPRAAAQAKAGRGGASATPLTPPKPGSMRSNRPAGPVGEQDGTVTAGSADVKPLPIPLSPLGKSGGSGLRAVKLLKPVRTLNSLQIPARSEGAEDGEAWSVVCLDKAPAGAAPSSSSPAAERDTLADLSSASSASGDDDISIDDANVTDAVEDAILQPRQLPLSPPLSPVPEARFARRGGPSPTFKRSSGGGSGDPLFFASRVEAVGPEPLEGRGRHLLADLEGVAPRAPSHLPGTSSLSPSMPLGPMTLPLFDRHGDKSDPLKPQEEGGVRLLMSLSDDGVGAQMPVHRAKGAGMPAFSWGTKGKPRRRSEPDSISVARAREMGHNGGDGPARGRKEGAWELGEAGVQARGNAGAAKEKIENVTTASVANTSSPNGAQESNELAELMARVNVSWASSSSAEAEERSFPWSPDAAKGLASAPPGDGTRQGGGTGESEEMDPLLAPYRSRRTSQDHLAVRRASSDGPATSVPYLKRFASHLSGVRAVAFDAGGSSARAMVTASDDCTLRLWRLSEANVSRDGRGGASADAVDAEPQATFRGHLRTVCCAALASATNRAFSGGVDGSIRVWDLPPADYFLYASSGHVKPSAKRVIAAHTDVVWDISAHPVYQHLLLSAGADGTMRLWDTNQPSPHVRTFTQRMTPTTTATRVPWAEPPDASSPHVAGAASPGNAEGASSGARPTCVEFCPLDDCRSFVAGFADATGLRFDVETGVPIAEMRAAANAGDKAIDGAGGSSAEDSTSAAQVNQIACHPWLPVAVVAYESGMVRTFDLNQGGAQVADLQAHPATDGTSCVAIDSGGWQLATGDHAGVLKIWVRDTWLLLAYAGVFLYLAYSSTCLYLAAQERYRIGHTRVTSFGILAPGIHT
eukprot:jgi/Mesvir1/2292/Mv19329-RA.2